MKVKHISIIAVLLALAGCTRNEDPAGTPQPLRVAPLITKATDVDFEDGDVIGLTVLRDGASVYADNVPLSYAGGVFSGELYWYLEPESRASLSAYYPYSGSGVPTSFTVASDQSSGLESSDFIAGWKQDVLPTRNAVDMVFRHQFTKIKITICNQTGGSIRSVTLGGSIPVARLNVSEGLAVVDTSASASDIIAFNLVRDTVWNAIVVPQKVAFDFKVTLSDGKVLTQKLKEMDVLQSFQYAVSAVVYRDDIKIVTSGQIQDWLDGGDIPGGDTPTPEPDLEEHLDEGWFSYHGDRYSVAKMADGKWWMTSNMRYVPAGLSPCGDLQNVTAGIYYPVVVNSDKTAAEFSTDEKVIEANGYLYQSETALGLKVGDIDDIGEASALEGVRGICPQGWHVPTVDDIVHLVGKVALYDYPEGQSEKTGAYYDPSLGQASIKLLDGDGFNAGSWGAVTIIDNTKTSATIMGFLKGNPDKITSGYLCGSSYASATPVDKEDPSKGYKNFQFWALMPMSGNGTFNGSKLNYRIAAVLRCVRDDS